MLPNILPSKATQISNIWIHESKDLTLHPLPSSLLLWLEPVPVYQQNTVSDASGQIMLQLITWLLFTVNCNGWCDFIPKSVQNGRKSLQISASMQRLARLFAEAHQCILQARQVLPCDRSFIYFFCCGWTKAFHHRVISKMKWVSPKFICSLPYSLEITSFSAVPSTSLANLLPCFPGLPFLPRLLKDLAYPSISSFQIWPCYFFFKLIVDFYSCSDFLIVN